MPYKRILRLSLLSTVVILILAFIAFEYTPVALRWRAERAVAGGQTHEAIRLYSRTVSISPGDTDSHMRLVELYNVLLKYDTEPLESPMFPKLLHHLETAAQRTDDVALQERVTRIYGMLGDHTQTRKTALRAAALESKDPDFQRMAVVEAIDQGKLEFAHSLLQKLTADPRKISFATLLVQAQYQQAVYDVVGLKKQLAFSLKTASQMSESGARTLQEQDVNALFRLLRAAVELDDPSTNGVDRANEAFEVVRKVAVTRQSTTELISAYTNAIALVNAAHRARPEDVVANATLRDNRQWLLDNCRSLVVTLEAAPVPALCEDVAAMKIPAQRLEEIATLRSHVRESITAWGDTNESDTLFWSVGLDDTPQEEPVLNAG